ncbi:hypothetical protein PR048_008561 [Dryococelus australis]|uniref:Uncharacterized protein n=1 Tax=Dryococelus australis TaxID=614101 RepID=A0ABQ9HXG4_9NEOP|nr:hypothetical protein PR048_008561 [Dryococelus australis]
MLRLFSTVWSNLPEGLNIVFNMGRSQGGGEKDESDMEGSVVGPGTAKSSSAESIHQSSGTGNSTPVQPRTASIRARPTSSRITAAELEELFQRQQGAPSEMVSSHFQVTTPGIASQPSSPARAPRVYASVAEMKRSKGKRFTCYTAYVKLFQTGGLVNGGIIRWPACSPNLIPLDFSLWGILKDRVYNTVPTLPNDTQERIVAACKGIMPKTLQAACHLLHVRLQMCFPVDGKPIEHMP